MPRPQSIFMYPDYIAGCCKQKGREREGRGRRVEKGRGGGERKGGEERREREVEVEKGRGGGGGWRKGGGGEEGRKGKGGDDDTCRRGRKVTTNIPHDCDPTSKHKYSEMLEQHKCL